MTQDNRRKNLQDEVERAEKALRAAEALAGAGLYNDSVSRSYYAAFHLVGALLSSRGMEKTRSSTIHQFDMEFIHTGLFSSSSACLIGDLEHARERADYGVAVRFSEDDAKVKLDQARSFVQDALAFLRGEGWLS